MASSIQPPCVDVELTPWQRGQTFRELAPYFLLALFTGLFLFPFLRALAWNPDEGIYLYGAQITAQGAIPGRDFVELQGPGTFYWLALFFKIFGTSLFTARSLLLFTGVATAVLIFHLSRAIGATGLFAAIFVAATSLPLGVMNSPHYDSNLFALLSFSCFLYSIRRHALTAGRRIHGSMLFFAGVLAGLTTCFLQQKGFYLTVAFVVTLRVLDRRAWLRPAAILAAAYASVVLAEGFLYAAAKALPSLIYANLIWPLSTYESVNRAPYGFSLRESLWRGWFSSLHDGLPAPAAAIIATLFSLPYVLILILPAVLPVMALRSRAIAFRRDVIPYWIAGYALWASELHRWDLGHLRNGCVILVVLFFALCEWPAGKARARIAFFITACLVLSAAGDVVGASTRNVALHTRRGTVYSLDRDHALEFLLSRTKPGDAVFIYPYAPIYYFLADLRNPTRWSNLMYGINTGEQFREAVNDLERKKVRYVLWDAVFSGQALSTLFPAYHHPPAPQQIMEPYLETHYHQIAFENGFRILERNEIRRADVAAALAQSPTAPVPAAGFLRPARAEPMQSIASMKTVLPETAHAPGKIR